MSSIMSTKQLTARTRRARKNLAFKVILQKPFNRELNTYFNNILKDFSAIYAATGRPLRVQEYTDETRALLRKQYMRIGRSFQNEMRSEMVVSKNFNYGLLLKQDERTQDEIEALVTAATIAFIKQQTPQRSFELDTTTNQNINDSLMVAEAQLRADGKEITNITLAAAATKILKSKFDGRKGTISNTYTNFMAESVKTIEATIITATGPIDITNVIGAIPITSGDLSKEWASALKQTTRAAHAAADGQVVDANEPFIVDGEKLMYPMDTSFGASPGNTKNCLCSVLYST